MDYRISQVTLYAGEVRSHFIFTDRDGIERSGKLKVTKQTKRESSLGSRFIYMKAFIQSAQFVVETDEEIERLRFEIESAAKLMKELDEKYPTGSPV